MIREILNLTSYWNRSVVAIAKHDFANAFEKTLRDLSPFGINSLEGRTVLDLGCGQRFPFSLLAASQGAQVTALDMNYVKPDALPLFFWKSVKMDGVKRAVKSVGRRVLFDRKYYSQLQLCAKRRLLEYVGDTTFVVADPMSACYPLGNNSFDLIVSIAVIEHVADVSAFFSEVHRLLKRDGLFYGIIHNFYSLSGGHRMEWAYPDTGLSSNVPPWDHLRRNLFPTHVFLNRLKPDEYRSLASLKLQVLLFEARDINHDAYAPEGEILLTPEIQAELSNYPRELLLTRSYCIVCRRLAE